MKLIVNYGNSSPRAYILLSTRGALCFAASILFILHNDFLFCIVPNGTKTSLTCLRFICVFTLIA